MRSDINSGATNGYFLLNAIFTSDNSTRAYVINAENGISGVGLYNKIETLSGGGSLTFNCDVKLYATAEINAVGASLTLANLLMNGQTLSSYGSNSLNITGVMNGSGTYNIKSYGITVTYSGLDTSSFRGTGYQIMSGSFLNELGPVTEPATWVAMVALVFGGGLCAFRRRIQGNPDKS